MLQVKTSEAAPECGWTEVQNPIGRLQWQAEARGIIKVVEATFSLRKQGDTRNRFRGVNSDENKVNTSDMPSSGIFIRTLGNTSLIRSLQLCSQNRSQWRQLVFLIGLLTAI